MINVEDLYRQEGLYLYGGKVWKIAAYCPGPSVTMKCTTPKEQMDFGLGGELEKSFKEIKETKNEVSIM